MQRSGTGEGGTLPFDGILQISQFESAQVPVETIFPKSSWSPELRSQLILGEFGGSNWREFDESETSPG
jgi:hypothetical protein